MYMCNILNFKLNINDRCILALNPTDLSFKADVKSGWEMWSKLKPGVHREFMGIYASAALWNFEKDFNAKDGEWGSFCPVGIIERVNHELVEK